MLDSGESHRSLGAAGRTEPMALAAPALEERFPEIMKIAISRLPSAKAGDG